MVPLFTRAVYSGMEKVLILNWPSRRVVAEQPKPRKLSRVMEEYFLAPGLPKVQMESRTYPFSSRYASI
ncbi:hypothetical protein D3C71_2219550 [compost metagenome]